MKNVIIISASARKNGNSDLLCNEFLRGAEETGNTVEKVCLGDLKIGYCMGCGVCNTTHECVQKDDMKDLLDKIVCADVIVLATPVYFYTMNAQLKTMIDRCVPRYTEISNKEFYFIATAADTNQSMLEKTIDGLRGFTDDCLKNPIEKGVIYATGVWDKGAVTKTKFMEQAYQMGKNV